ncbi:TonB-dependent receptor [Mucilaginibacter sp. HMF5004]|uniref:SusC/RagA family TonB-linked outer membrane protein n=1 Tax=Mucilaginibacter rivuli TaxID=2857527 RepID=UPI001C5ECB75|nr:TonB-dependent receptor [Mucilaginibacter rivuli]MBW4888509.1 TonB-dependent receptor [Mucilaginibacter rivuli]
MGFNAMAQTPTVAVIKGSVIDSKDKSPLPGVTVVEVNQNDRQVAATSTDDKGRYVLKISSKSNKVRFSFIGYQSQTITIDDKTTIDVLLKEAQSRDLDELVVRSKVTERISTGFGDQSPRDKIGAVASVTADMLAGQPVTTIDQMIQGQAPGVQVVSNSGDPGGGTSIVIRGQGSISAGNDPLYVIDGIPIISTPFDNSNAAANYARSNPIADLNPNDIQKIDILKDASAAAIYGARAANGVVLITTKRGKPGVTSIIVNSQFSLQQSPRPIPVLNATDYKVMRLEAEQNNNNINPSTTTLLPLVDDPTYQNFWLYQSNTNWLAALSRLGFTQNYNMSLSGGGESARYNFSTSYSDALGSMINTGFKRFTGRFNLDYKVSDRLRFTANIAYSRSKTNSYANNGGGTLYYNALVRSPAMPIYDVSYVDGSSLPNYMSLGGVNGSQDNPIAFANSVDNASYSTNLKPNIRAELQIAKGLKFTNNASLDFVGDNASYFQPAIATGVIWNSNQFNRVDTRDFERTQMIFDNLLSYTKTFGKKLVSNFLFGNTFNTFKSNQLTAQAYATADGSMKTLGNGGGYNSIGSNSATETILSQFVRADMVYADTYGFNFTMRRDGSSKFGGSNKYGYFPSVGGYWRLSNKKALKDSKLVSDLKLRASWGQLGNSGIPNYAYISQFAQGTNYMGLSGVSQNNPQLNHLKWETSESTNLGLDASFFKDRIGITLEVYNRITKDLLYNLALPTTSGLTSSILTNLGNIRNRGIELNLTGTPVALKNFSWNTSFNIATNINKVLSLPGGTVTTSDSYGGFTSQIKEGDALGTYYGLVFKGVYARDADAIVHDKNGNIIYELDGITPRSLHIGSETGNVYKGGDAIFEDFNHDGIINDQDKVRIGDANPKFFGGYNNTFTYKNWSFRFFIQYQYGNDIIDGIRLQLESMTNSNNQALSVRRRWRTQGDVTDIPRALATDTRNVLPSTRWIEDGSYARIKFVTLSYKVPAAFLRRINISGLDMFFTANNLYTWTKYTGADPEISLGSNPAFIGVDQGLTPQTKGYTFGFNLKF